MAQANATGGTGLCHLWEKWFPPLVLEVVSLAVVVELRFMPKFVLAEKVGNGGLQTGRYRPSAPIVAVVLRAAAEDVVQLIAHGDALLVLYVLQQVLHAVCQARGAVFDVEGAGINVSGRGQHTLVVLQAGGSQRGCMVAQASGGQRAVVLEADGPGGGDVGEL